MFSTDQAMVQLVFRTTGKKLHTLFFSPTVMVRGIPRRKESLGASTGDDFQRASVSLWFTDNNCNCSVTAAIRRSST